MFKTLEDWIPRGSQVAIVDVPVHRNIGDLFILAATMRLLADRQCRIVYRGGLRDYRTRSASARIGPDTIVVGLGGGNFGDFYRPYLRLRERVLRDFPDNRIVILPQSIHFDSAQEQSRIAERLSAHRDVRIAARDRASYDFARSVTPHAVLLPDTVHMLARPSQTECREVVPRGTVYLLRRDAEMNRMRKPPQSPVDWPTIFPDYLPRLVAAAALMPIAPRSWSERLHDRWSRYAEELLSRGFSWMTGVEHLVTDRLHAAILARLVERPVTLLDTASGKLTAYYGTWWYNDPAVTLAPRFPTAVEPLPRRASSRP